MPPHTTAGFLDDEFDNDPNAFYDDDEEDDEALENSPAVRTREGAGNDMPRRAGAGGSTTSQTEEQKALFELQLKSQEQEDYIRRLQMELAAAHAQRKTRTKRTKSATPSGLSTPDEGLAVSRSLSVASSSPASASDPIPASASASSSGKLEGTNPEVLQLLEVVKLAGRKYSFIVRPWPPPPAAFQFVQRPPVNPLDMPSRYPTNGTKEEKEQALLRAYAAEIHDAMPEIVKPHVTNQLVVSEFCKVIYDQKSKIISVARSRRSEIFKDTAGLNTSSFVSVTAMQQDPKIIEYRGATPTVPYPPILFPPGQAGDASRVFMSPSMALLPHAGSNSLQFIRLALFGQSSLKFTDYDGPNAPQYKPRYNAAAKQWDVNDLSVGMIAFAAVAVRYLLYYPEEDFDTEGTSSKVPYESLFNRYTKDLIKYWNTPGMVQTRRWLKARVFKNIASAAGSLATPDGDFDEEGLDLDALYPMPLPPFLPPDSVQFNSSLHQRGKLWSRLPHPEVNLLVPLLPFRPWTLATILDLPAFPHSNVDYPPLVASCRPVWTGLRLRGPCTLVLWRRSLLNPPYWRRRWTGSRWHSRSLLHCKSRLRREAGVVGVVVHEAEGQSQAVRSPLVQHKSWKVL
ncbi:hypothetical protein BV20DRAFT_983860 [Pilatotrama ljubarskyi]|nr:hypothetical protein BV20DRAFT_983860 [Pilatotrama ljubarskyi]